LPFAAILARSRRAATRLVDNGKAKRGRDPFTGGRGLRRVAQPGEKAVDALGERRAVAAEIAGGGLDLDCA